MKRTLAALAAAVIAALAVPGAAHATGDHATCGMPFGWYANPDEQTRLPKPVEHGLQFSGNQLIHHVTTTTVEHLTPGGFVAHPAPDQPSFFSVEVYGTDGGYATLRWNTTTSKWDMVTGGQIYSNASPALLVDMVTPHKSHHVISFGVGYTANPPGTVTTVVTSVRFDGNTYPLWCQPAPGHSPPSPTKSPTSAPTSSPTATASATTSTSTSTGTTGLPSTSSSATAAVPVSDNSSTGSGLAITGPQAGLIAAGAVGVLAFGGLLFLAARRRKTRFTA